MKKLSKILLLLLTVTGVAYASIANRGIGKRNKNKISLNIINPYRGAAFNLRSAIAFNLKLGLKYTGSLTTTYQQFSHSSITSNTLVTYQKGNTVYIIPYKQKVAVPEMRQGYTGIKLILRPHR